MPDVMKTKLGAFFVQPGGANNPVHWIKCATVEDVEEPKGDISLVQCFLPDASGWETLGQLESPPDPISTTIDTLVFPAMGRMERILEGIPFAMYFLSRTGGLANNFNNYTRGLAMAPCRIVNASHSNIVHRDTDNEQGKNYDVQSSPPLLKLQDVKVQRMVTTEDDALNDIVWSDEGNDILQKGMDAIAVADSAIAPALGNVQVTADAGAAWAATAADPFAAGLSIFSVVKFMIDQNTIRYLAAREGGAAVNGEVAYSDDGGATWTTAAVGATVGQGAFDSGALFALDAQHIWFAVGDALAAGNGGFIYFSEDGGQTWTAQEEAILTTEDFCGIHFVDEFVGYAVATADIIVKTIDGGDTWEGATATGGGGDLYCVWVLEDRIWVGDDNGSLYYSEDDGVTWTERTGWTGSGVGSVDDIAFYGDYVGYMLSNTAAPVGTVLMTINGGYTWRTLTTPTNDGLNAISIVDENTAYVVGEVEAVSAVAIILKISA